MKTHKSAKIAVVSIATAVVISGCSDPDSSPVRSFDLGSSNSAVSTTAIGSDGSVYWAWFDRDDDATNVYFARLEPGVDRPTPPVRVNRVDGNANMHGQAPAQVATGPDGTIYVAWTNRIEVDGRRFPASNLLFARSTDGGATFSDAVTVNDDAGGMPTGHTFHDMTVASDGTIFVSWIDTRVLDAARSQAAEETSNHADEDTHMHGHHEAMSQDAPGPEIRVARSTDGGRSFHPSVVVDRSSCPCCRTSLAVGPNGTVYVGWRKVYGGEIRDMAIARSTDQGLTFSEAERVHVDGWHFDGCPHTGPSLVVDESGRLHVAWYTGVSDHSGLYYAVSDGDRFSEPVALASNAPVSQVRSSRAPQGGVWLAWENRKEGSIQIAHADNGTIERVAMTIEGSQPALAVGEFFTSVSTSGSEGVTATVVDNRKWPSDGRE